MEQIQVRPVYLFLAMVMVAVAAGLVGYAGARFDWPPAVRWACAITGVVVGVATGYVTVAGRAR